MSTKLDAEQAGRTCDRALVRAFALIGKRWNGIILGTLMDGAASFSELRRGVSGISDSVLSERLSELAGAGLVVRTVNDGPPVTVEYTLTASGEALVPTLHQLISWSAANLSD
jgi:DNA-binding HxlR family transcriptional regulator